MIVGQDASLRDVTVTAKSTKSKRDRQAVEINRAPVLTLWAAVVANRLGFTWDESLTLGRAVAGLNAYSKGKSLGLYKPRPKETRERRRKMSRGERISVDLLNRAVPCVQTDDGVRALSKDKPIDPDSVTRYLEGKFEDALGDAKTAMQNLARSVSPSQLVDEAYDLYTQFRPDIPSGKKGWGASGRLDFRTIDKLARQHDS